mmetsp:Transcript_30639/g.37289  ORF Transcript_30639/g.37289 Transcript_30639/m.37289 type:complete len:243 (+) Transcript_30639:301-1029(+)
MEHLQLHQQQSQQESFAYFSLHFRCYPWYLHLLLHLIKEETELHAVLQHWKEFSHPRSLEKVTCPPVPVFSRDFLQGPSSIDLVKILTKSPIGRVSFWAHAMQQPRHVRVNFQPILLSRWTSLLHLPNVRSHPRGYLVESIHLDQRKAWQTQLLLQFGLHHHDQHLKWLLCTMRNPQTSQLIFLGKAYLFLSCWIKHQWSGTETSSKQIWTHQLFQFHQEPQYSHQDQASVSEQTLLADCDQ